MTEAQKMGIGQLIEHIHIKNHSIKKVLGAHALGHITDVELFKQLNAIARENIPNAPAGYAAQAQGQSAA